MRSGIGIGRSLAPATREALIGWGSVAVGVGFACWLVFGRVL